MAHAKVTFEGNSHQPVALVRKEQASGPGPALRSPRPVLVLDDLHTLHDRDDIESDLGWLAEHLPNNVRLTDWRVRASDENPSAGGRSRSATSVSTPSGASVQASDARQCCSSGRFSDRSGSPSTVLADGVHLAEPPLTELEAGRFGKPETAACRPAHAAGRSHCGLERWPGRSRDAARLRSAPCPR